MLFQSLVRAITSSGKATVEIQSDQERPLVALINRGMAVCRAEHGMSITHIKSPVGDSRANGLAELGVREVKAKTRTLAFAAGELHGGEIKPNHPALAFFVALAAHYITVGQIGSDGLTAYQRRRGKKYGRLLAEPGEKVLFSKGSAKLKQTVGGDNSGSRWFEGIYLGVVASSNEILCGTRDGVYGAASFKRLPDGERSDLGLFNSFTGTPWHPIPAEPSTEPAATGVLACPWPVPVADLPPHAPPTPIVPRAFTIRRKVELAQYGVTPGCPGCRAAMENSPHAVQHSTACRERIRAEMAKSVDGRLRLEEENLRISRRMDQDMAGNVSDDEANPISSSDHDADRDSTPQAPGAGVTASSSSEARTFLIILSVLIFIAF